MVRQPRVVHRPGVPGQRAQHAAVELAPAGRRDRRPDRLADQFVAEAERRPVGDQHALGEGLLDGVRAAGARRGVALLSELDDVAVPLAARARVGHPVSKVRGVRALPNHVRRAHGAGWSLVGDAGYHRDPITGHGITDAFRDAELLADALTDGVGGARPEASALAAYESARDVALADVFRLTRELTAFPDPAHFVELQLELAEALDREATQLASRPEPAGLDAASAA
jgi:2-polyprenyl-6-methoxyphenol hydroxylase-like FAD-dependent oxidoreductase